MYLLILCILYSVYPRSVLSIFIWWATIWKWINTFWTLSNYNTIYIIHNASWAASCIAIFLQVFRCLFCPGDGMKFLGIKEEVFLDHVKNQVDMIDWLIGCLDEEQNKICREKIPGHLASWQPWQTCLYLNLTKNSLSQKSRLHCHIWFYYKVLSSIFEFTFLVILDCGSWS